MKRSSTGPGRIILALTLALGVAALAIVATSVGQGMVDSYSGRRYFGGWWSAWESYDTPEPPGSEHWILDPSGEWVLTGGIGYDQLVEMEEWSAPVELARRFQWRSTWRDRMAHLGNDHGSSLIYWNVIRPRGSQPGVYIIGTPGDASGFLGSAGFRRDAPPPEEWFDAILFSQPPGDTDCLVAIQQNRVYLIHFASRAVELLVDDLTSPIRSIGTWRPRYGGSPRDLGPVGLMVTYRRDGSDGQVAENSSLAIRTEDAIHIVEFAAAGSDSPSSRNHQDQFKVSRRRKIPLPEALRGKSFLVAPGKDDGLVVAIQRLYDIGSGSVDLSLGLLDADGTWQPTRNVTANLSMWYLDEPDWLLPLGSPLAVAGTVLFQHSGCWRDYEPVTGRLIWVRNVLWQCDTALAFTGLVGGVLAVICHRRQTRFRMSVLERIGWPLFVFLLGVPGWIGYRYSRRWPVVESCPACHRPIPRDAEACAACRHDFPLPAPTGLEIFA